MDRHLTFNSHVDQISAKCIGILIGLMHARHTIPKTILVTIVQALVMSIVRYCISLYGTCTGTELDRVQKLLKFGARVISGRRKHDHISDVLRELNWLDARSLVMYHRLCLVHTAIKTGRPESLTDAIGDVAGHRYPTRGCSRRILPRLHKELGRRRLCYGAVQAYNQLPFDTNIRGFRSRLKRHLLRVQHGDGV